MAQVNFDSISDYSTSENTNIQFFGLKNDKEEAIVRFIADSTEDFDIVTCHSITEAGKFRTVNCLGDNCPLCASGNRAAMKFYVHLIHYVKNADGTITPVPKVWQRSIAFARELRNYINDYGSLTNCLFKIIRNGKPKDVSTTYSLMVCNPAVYTESAYPIDVSAFENYKAISRAVWNKSFEDLTTFVATGAFPSKQEDGFSANVNTANGLNVYPESYDIPAPSAVNNTQNLGASYNNAPSAPSSMPWMNNQTMNRPQRTY